MGLRHSFVEPGELPWFVVGVEPDEESGFASASIDGVEGSGILSAPPAPVVAKPPMGILFLFCWWGGGECLGNLTHVKVLVSVGAMNSDAGHTQ